MELRIITAASARVATDLAKENKQSVAEKAVSMYLERVYCRIRRAAEDGEDNVHIMEGDCNMEFVKEVLTGQGYTCTLERGMFIVKW